MRKEESKTEITAAGELAPQLGSDKIDLVKGIVDMRRLTKINQIESYCMAYFMGVPAIRGGRFWARLCNNIQNLNVSIDGNRTNKLIQAIAAESGTAAVTELAKKPNIVARNVYDRGWRKKAEEKGQTIVE